MPTADHEQMWFFFFQLLYRGVISGHWGKVEIWGWQDWICQSFSPGAEQLVGAGLGATIHGQMLLQVPAQAGQGLAKEGQVSLWSPLSNCTSFPHKRHLAPPVHWKGILLHQPSHKSGLFYVRCKKISHKVVLTIICHAMMQQPSPFRVIHADLPWTTCIDLSVPWP